MIRSQLIEKCFSSDQFRRIGGREEDSSPNMTFSVLTGELDAYGGEICLMKTVIYCWPRILLN